MFYTGAYEGTIDAKNRLCIPSAVRAINKEGKNGRRFYLVPGMQRRTLSLYPGAYFERQFSDEAFSDLEHSDERAMAETMFYSMARLLDVDKQGRVCLPESVLKIAGIGRSVTITGMRDHLDLWRREDFERFIEDNWQRYPDLLRMARRRPTSPPAGPAGPR